jgi:hypothetical protein
VKVFDSMASELKPSKDTVGTPLANPDASFIFGGYSWVDKRFKLWTIAYRPGEKRFSADPPQWCTFSIDADRFLLRKKKKEAHDKSLGKIAFAGDQAKLARRLLLQKLNNRERSRRTSNLDMEPFEVVRDMLRDEAHADTIGGAPQVVKVYQYMHSTPLAVYWPTKSNGTVNLQGRECLGYERIDPWVLDPDSLTSEPQPVPEDRAAKKKKRRSRRS